ncbi:hypothetical protein [Alkalicoccobacillus porphyridii]|uniref:DUF4306 domain-containing protein n=1 Tax=Alkalicoccobacillus porphyridii TaxID=2597270 RepID=A0A553ZWW8_9BACI|nr:hypothetical protein [Alkalicoccobacillus porphyridii]TSB45944.1 hypothetical protein FN960_13625 [Alkalicoccobacillus porphyridii]
MSNIMKLFLFISILLCTIGLIMVIGSTHFGVSRADSWVQASAYDTFDPEIYLARMQAYINSFQIIGGILIVAGLSALIGAILKTVNFQK